MAADRSRDYVSVPATCPWCRGSGLIAPSPFVPEVEKPEPWPELLARAPWGYPPEVADRYRAWIAPAVCPRCATSPQSAPAPAEAACDLADVDDEDVDLEVDVDEPFRLSC